MAPQGFETFFRSKTEQITTLNMFRTLRIFQKEVDSECIEHYIQFLAKYYLVELYKNCHAKRIDIQLLNTIYFRENY